MSERNYEAADKLLLAREERKRERAIAKLDAAEDNFRKTLAKAIKGEARKTVAREARQAVDASRNGQTPDERHRLAGEGMNTNDGETITGFDEKSRPWESDY